MFIKWKLKRERKRIQSHCPHEYHVVGKSTECDMYDCWNITEIFCPLCDSEKSVVENEAKRILAKQVIRKQYDEQLKI